MTLLPDTIDVLIPHFCDPSGLARSLNSVEAQDWAGKMRVIVYDDGSDPADYAQVETLVEQSGLTIDLIQGDANLGRPMARNRLLDHSTAPFVAWLDTGDVWYPTKISQQFETLQAAVADGRDPDRIWVTCPYDWKRDGAKPRRVVQQVSGDQTVDLLTGDKLRAYLWTLFGTRSSFDRAGRFDRRLPRLQDLDVFLSFTRRGGILIAPEDIAPLCCYFKDDVGRNAREIRRCFDLVFAKHALPLRKKGAAFERGCRTRADFVASRVARFNGQYGLYLWYVARALLRTPRFAFRRLFR